MPLAIYAAFDGSAPGLGVALALSLALLVVALATLLLVRAWRPGAAMSGNGAALPTGAAR